MILRSPYLISLDLFLWSYLKNVVMYANLLINIQKLRNKIIVVCNLLNKNQILTVTIFVNVNVDLRRAFNTVEELSIN